MTKLETEAAAAVPEADDDDDHGLPAAGSETDDGADDDYGPSEADGEDDSATWQVPAAAAAPRSALWDGDLGRYVLQKVVFHSRGVVVAPRLYFADLSGGAKLRGEALALAAGAKVGFNTYANSFFASYWEEFTDIRAFSLSGKVTGRGVLHLYRSTREGGAVKVGEYVVADTFHVHFDIFSYLPGDGGAGRFFFDLEAVTAMEVEKIAFSTFLPPEQTATFTLGLCTYRKEKYITNLALCLETYFRRGGTAVAEVIVVDNDAGGDGLSILEKAARRMGNVRMIRQANIGGAGGFARGLHLSLQSRDSSHHIFMDDDVFLDIHMLDRLQAFVSYCREPHVVGGQMMNMARPSMLYEGGSRLDYWGFLSKVGEDIDGTVGSKVAFFDQVRRVDYNAWWFACVPKAHARAAGLPLNIFIRGDDFEYGLRLARAGVATISLPGLFVWHEPFEAKSAPWLEYYNWRNRLIVAAIYNDPERLDIQPADMLRNIMVEHLEAGRFEIAYAMGRGMLDFLRGPTAVLTRDAEALHDSVRADLAEVAEDATAMAARLRAGMTDMGAQPPVHQMLTLGHATRLGGRPRDSATIPWLDHPAVAALEAVLARYWDGADRVKADWQQQAHALSSPGAWCALYGWQPAGPD